MLTANTFLVSFSYMGNTASPEIAVLTHSKWRQRFSFKAVVHRVLSGRKEAIEGGEPKPLEYNAEDVEEANRISEAIRRQHAR